MERKPRARGFLDTARLRVDEIADLILRGAQRRQIYTYIREQEEKEDSLWFALPDQTPLSRRMIEKYLKRAESQISASIEKDRAKIIESHLTKRRLLYAEALMSGDQRTALAVLESLAKIERIHDAPKTAEDTTPPNVGLDFGAWTKRYLPHYLTHEDSAFHVWLRDLLNSLHVTRGVNWNVLAPRGSGKSVWSTQAYPLYAALHGLEKFIVLCADTGDQAGAYLGAIRAELEGNDAIRRDYAKALEGARLNSGRLRLANGCMIEASSTGGKIRGRKNGPHRPSLLVGDDLQNIEHVISPTMRDHSWQWFQQDFMNAGSPETNVLILGTALHREGLVNQLQETPGWKSRIWKTLIQQPYRMDLWREWENLLHNHDDASKDETARKFYESQKAEMDEGASVLWPARFPLYEVMRKRATIGVAAFESEQQNNPVNPLACEWPAEYFARPGMWFDQWPDGLKRLVLTLDPSKGGDARKGDYSALVSIGEDHRGVLYVEADLARRSTETMLADACVLCRDRKPERFVIETNQYQELLKPILRQTAESLGVHLPELIEVVNSSAKELRIRRLGPYFAKRLVRFRRNSPGTELLLNQLRDFPTGSHDDGPDALEMGVRYLKDAKTLELR